jgi:murein DD-endopeptidase MepM/ murein hydrolase activator NlpD
MKYTVRYAHLAKKPELKVGDKVYEGDKIGIMGEHWSEPRGAFAS